MQEKAKTQLDIYYSELADLKNNCPANMNRIKELQREEIRNNFNTVINKDLKDMHAENVDSQTLQILLYMTQYTISELKNSKSKKLDNVRSMAINPYDLENRLREMVNDAKRDKTNTM